MSISEAVSLSRLVLVTDPRPAAGADRLSVRRGAEAVSVRRYRLARMRSEERTPPPPRHSFEHLKRSYD